MRQYAKQINIVIFLLLSALFLWLSPFEKFSTNLSSLLPQNEETKLLEIYQDFESSREVLVAIKSENIEEIKTFEKRILENKIIKKSSNFFSNKEFKSYIKEYQFYLQDFNHSNLDKVQEKLKKKYKSLSSNLQYSPIDSIDPLGLFSPQKVDTNFEIKNGYIYLKEYGYMSIFTFEEGVNPKEVYDIFIDELKDGVKIFSPIFYFVENEKSIKSEVNILIFLAISILLFLYIAMLRDVPLLFNTILALVSSSLLALSVVTSIWSEVSVFVMVIGIAISTISIDYMFHNYFCGFYEKRKRANRAVFYGFLSTFLAFAIISLVDFPLIRQVSIYALVSLSFSYVVFTYLFPFMGFTCKASIKPLVSFELIKNYKYFALVLLLVIVYSSLHVKIDFNIKNLDFENVKIQKLENFFAKKLRPSDSMPIIIKAKTLDELIDKCREIEGVVPLSVLLSSQSFKQREKIFSAIDFDHLREKISKEANMIGFRENFFKKSYPSSLLFPKKPNLDLERVKELGFDVIFDGYEYYSFGFTSSSENIEGVYIVDSIALFEDSLKKASKDLLLYGVLILLCIVLILYRAARDNFFRAFCFVLFPVATILFVISFSSINILQLFMLFIIISLSIDYGIYMSQDKQDGASQKAVLFSLMSTFAGFGVLIFSSIGVLFFVGQVAVLGLLAISILIIVGKK